MALGPCVSAPTQILHLRSGGTGSMHSSTIRVRNMYVHPILCLPDRCARFLSHGLIGSSIVFNLLDREFDAEGCQGSIDSSWYYSRYFSCDPSLWCTRGSSAEPGFNTLVSERDCEKSEGKTRIKNSEHVTTEDKMPRDSPISKSKCTCKMNSGWWWGTG